MKKLSALIVLAASIAAAAAAEPQKWTVSTQSEFLKGELRGISVTSDGRLILAPALQAVYDTQQAYLFSIAQDNAGALVVGSGNSGKIFKVEGSSGKLLATLEELAVYALAIDAQNRVIAGSSPDGKVYRIGADGKAAVIFDPKEKYIWSLAIDRSGNVYVGTGPRGVIYRIPAAGEAKPFYDSDETHVTSLAIDAEGNVLAGSAPNGYIYRITPQGKPFVLFDSPLSEVRSLTTDRYGNILAAALGESSRKGTAPLARVSGSDSVPVISVATAMATVTAEAGEADKDLPGTADEPRSVFSPRARSERSTIYQIDKEGVVERVYSSDSDVFYSLLVRNDGSLIVGSGPKGRLLSIDSRRLVTILAQAPEEQITGLVERDGKVYAASSNLGRVFQLLGKPVESGVFESEPLDARIVSSWGMISWKILNPAQGSIELATRSGNTKTPDKTWSDWSAPYRDRPGSYITSPKARFLQWKVTISTDARSGTLLSDSNMVESVSVSYIQQNVAPRIQSITLEVPSVAFLPYPPVSIGGSTGGGLSGARQKSLPRALRSLDARLSSPPPRRVFQPGVQSFTWEARDENDDELDYSLYYRAEGETAWKLLKAGLDDNHHTIEPNTLADGVYLLKVVASDASSNAFQQALTDESVSKAFVLDSSPPRVEVLSHKVTGARVEIAFKATTQVSSIYQADFSVESGKPQILFPRDGISDSRSEEYVFSTLDLKKGEHAVVLRVFDVVGNAGTAKVVVQIP
ncbi:MAG: hypothetical protein ACR2L2_13855 [Acidobacteriota bacterium]